MTPHSHSFTAFDEPSPTKLTGSELVALQLLARGYSVEQIAVMRGVALMTVLWELERPLTVLRAATRVGAIAEAIRRGLIV